MTTGPPRLIATAVAVAIACFAMARMLVSDPLLIVESVGLGVVVVWLPVLVVASLPTVRLAHGLGSVSRHARRHGVVYRLVSSGTPTAFVAGLLFPTIFVTTAADAALSDDELRAVLYHEDHHRRTRGPLRAAARAAWSVMLLRRPFAQRWSGMMAILDEIGADRAAMRRGTTLGTLASALLKTEVAPGLGFTAGDDLRVRALVDGRSPAIGPRASEWLPLVIVTAMIIGCWIAGTTTPL